MVRERASLTGRSQLEALVTHAARHNGGRGGEEMINYESFLQSFDVVDVEDPEDSEGKGRGKVNAQAELSSTSSRHRAQSNAGLRRAASATGSRSS
jgi:hypothetical protein